MEISEAQLDRQSLEQFGQEAAALLRGGDFDVLAERFGYAMAYGREKVSAIEADLKAENYEDAASVEDTAPYLIIKYYGADALESTGLVAAVECLFRSVAGEAFEFSLVVTGKGSKRYLCLESVGRAF